MCVEAVLFPEPKESTNSKFLSSGQVEMFLMDKYQVFEMFASIRVKSNVAARDMSVVCEFPDIFPRYF